MEEDSYGSYDSKIIDDKVLHLYNGYSRLLSLDKIFEQILKELKLEESNKEEYKHLM